MCNVWYTPSAFRPSLLHLKLWRKTQDIFNFLQQCGNHMGHICISQKAHIGYRAPNISLDSEFGVGEFGTISMYHVVEHLIITSSIRCSCAKCPSQLTLLQFSCSLITFPQRITGLIEELLSNSMLLNIATRIISRCCTKKIGWTIGWV